MARTGRRSGTAADVEEMLDELYVLPPPEFVPRREELAAAARTAGRADDAKRLRAARRPPLAAWAANLLRRSRPEEAERFLELGQALREAYSSLDAGGMKELSAQRRRLVGQLSRQAAGLAREAGHPLSDAVQRDVETTLDAVLADLEAADQWATGRLERTLTPPSEFPAGAPPADAARPRTAEPPARRAPGRTRQRDDLAERRKERQERLERARAEAEAAEQRLAERRDERAEAEAALRTAREQHRAAEEEVSEAEQERDRAEERLRSAREEKERAEGLRQEAEGRDRSAADALTRAERAAKEAAREAKRLSPRKR